MRHRRFKQAVSFLTTSSILAGLILPGASVLADSYDDIVLADVFPDEILRQCIADEYDGDNDGILIPEELGNEPLRTWTFPCSRAFSIWIFTIRVLRNLI